MKGEVQQYQDFLLGSQFDVIVNFAAQQWATDAALPILERLTAKKVFVPTGFSGLYLPVYKDYFTQMQEWMKTYDANVFLSARYRDINFARDNGITAKYLITNGAAFDEFAPTRETDIRKKLGIAPNNFLIIHVGTHTGAKGHAEAIELFARANIKNATLVIIGNIVGSARCLLKCKWQSTLVNYTPKQRRRNKKVLLVDMSRADTVAAYQQADLFLFPSNIECSPIVLFECLASRTPFLTTDVGNAVEIIEWTGAGQILPTTKTPNGCSVALVKESAAALEKLYFDIERRATMAENGYKRWHEKYTWEKVADSYELLYQELMAGRRCAELAID